MVQVGVVATASTVAAAKELLIILSIVLVLYFVIGIVWAIFMNKRVKHYPKRKKWTLFFFNLNMWPELMVIWVGMKIGVKLHQCATKYRLSRKKEEPFVTITLQEYLANQRAINKKNRTLT